MNIQIPSHDEIQAAFKRGETDIVALFAKVSQQIVELAEQLAKQAEVIKGLQAKAAKNSRNSGKPPSSDGYGKANKTESLRKPGERSNGDQPGHTGSTLNTQETPDYTVNHDPSHCKYCHISRTDVCKTLLFRCALSTIGRLGTNARIAHYGPSNCAQIKGRIYVCSRTPIQM
jgi:hypothetical protein